jgi:ectoine hydroxylase-related dioxygenase (phytanoyl-CoA dioxygenase family)
MSTNQLPQLDSAFQLTQDEIRSFRTNGHLHCRSVLTPEELSFYRKVINDAAYRYNTETREMKLRDTYGKAFLQIMNLWEVDEEVRKFTLAKRFGKMAAALLGVEKVRLYHDQALYKEAGGGHTPWHQDQYYWPLDTANTITMWMPLIPISVEMGMLSFASGSHVNGAVENIPISDESDVLLDAYVKDKNYTVSRPISMNGGDASWHYGWTLHNAPGNQSEQTREVMTIIYFADGARVTQPVNQNQENDRLRWLAGIQPGALADSNLNPVIS